MTYVRHARDVVSGPLQEFGGAPARVLHRHACGLVAEVDFPPATRWLAVAPRAQTVEIFVLDGMIDCSGRRMQRHDYAHVPSLSPLDVVSESGARLLAFFDSPRSTDGADMTFVEAASSNWRRGTISQRDTGVTLALEVRDLRAVSATGQRTWLLRADAGLNLPYERHRTVEEGYIVDGNYRLTECLSDGDRHDRHFPGSYFYRPAGIVHGGPQSGSDGEFTMLLRTPEALTVEFVDRG